MITQTEDQATQREATITAAIIHQEVIQHQAAVRHVLITVAAAEA